MKLLAYELFRMTPEFKRMFISEVNVMLHPCCYKVTLHRRKKTYIKVDDYASYQAWETVGPELQFQLKMLYRYM